MWQRASITGYNKLNKHPNGTDPLQWIKRKSQTQLLHIKECPRFKPQKNGTTTPTQSALYIRTSTFDLSSDANEAGRLGRFECCVLIGSVQSGTDNVNGLRLPGPLINGVFEKRAPGPVDIPMAVVSRCRLAKNCDVEDFQDVICIAKVT